MVNKILYQFIDNISQFVFWKDLNSTFLGCNQNFAEYAGLKNESEIIGKTDYDLFDASDADFFNKIDKEVMTSGKSQLNFEESITIPDLGKRWLSTSKVPLYDDSNNVVGILCWFNDITAFKELQIQIDENNKSLLDYNLQLKGANRDLELTNLDLEQFTYAASHDLKGPIRTIKSFASLLKVKEKGKLNEKSMEYVDFICQSSERMSNLVDDILSYARTGSQELLATDVDLNQIVSEKITGLKSLIESKSVEVNLQLPTKKIKAYPQLIGLVFYNLINNGIKFNDSPRPFVNCDYLENEHYWTFIVEDNGPGIEPKFAKQIFEPFKRLVGQKIEGSGLGLSICKRVAILHNGDIWIENNSMGNTVFKFSIAKDLQ